MAQGMTLQAGIADCGDVLDTPSALDQMNTYVILSRLKRAEGLLLLRAFAHDLFTRGAPAGPESLLQSLRERVDSHGYIHPSSAQDVAAPDPSSAQDLSLIHI